MHDEETYQISAQRRLVVREVPTQDGVTVLEILSLANKLTHAGREAYEAKRTIVLGSKTSLVEIDLLRAGRHYRPFRQGKAITVFGSVRLPLALAPWRIC